MLIYKSIQEYTSDKGYKTIKVFEPKKWLASCPIKIEKEQLLLDNQKNQIILQIKLFNLSKKIRSVYMNVECFDDTMDYVTKNNDISY